MGHTNGLTQRAAVVVLLAFFGVTVRGQTHVMSALQSDRILIGPEFVPRYLNLPNVLVVPRGSTVEAAADSTWDYIEVAGTLRISRMHDTVLRFTHLFVLPTGVLDVGTQADPIPATRKVELIVRDVPIDTSRDPFQWGNGLLNFHKQTRVGAEKTSWTTLASEVIAGATTITLAIDPIGWRAGDELLLPDTRQTAFPARPRRETTVTIATIAGRVVTLSKPLDFDHLAIRDPDGAIVLQPRVANLTRNIVIRSENPDGTPGHTANVGMDATWDVRYNEFVGLGRTRTVTLDSAVLATGHIGTNQQGRYNDHQHHAQGFGSFSVGNAYRGRGVGGKWGLVVHGTHDAFIAENIADSFPGSGFVTEDGYEVRNTFRRNLAVYSIGNITEDVNIEDGNVKRANNPGAAGSGFWLRGIANTIDSNEAWNNAIGINLFNQDQVAASFPSAPGGAPDTAFNRRTAVPSTFVNNVTAANISKGLEYWGVPRFPVVNQTSAFNGQVQFFQSQSEPAMPYFVNSQFVCFNGTTKALSSGVPYVSSLDIDGGRIVGCYTAIDGGAQLVRLKNLRLQNVVNLNFFTFPVVSSSQENVLHVVLPGHPAQFIFFGDDRVWSGVGPTPPVGASRWNWQRGSQHTIKNWQGTGQDFQLFVKQQLASTPAWPSFEPWPNIFNCPDAGLTMGQCWERYGVAMNGEAVNDADTVPLEGLVTGFARPGLVPRLGPPRAVITAPTARAPATVIPNNGNPFVWLYGLLTGDPAAASSTILVSVDGSKPFTVTPESGDTIRFPVKQVSAGQHEVRTWRTDGNHNPMGSPMVFHYVVGTAASTQERAGKD